MEFNSPFLNLPVYSPFSLRCLNVFVTKCFCNSSCTSFFSEGLLLSLFFAHSIYSVETSIPTNFLFKSFAPIKVVPLPQYGSITIPSFSSKIDAITLVGNSMGNGAGCGFERSGGNRQIEVSKACFDASSSPIKLFSEDFCSQKILSSTCQNLHPLIFAAIILSQIISCLIFHFVFEIHS